MVVYGSLNQPRLKENEILWEVKKGKKVRKAVLNPDMIKLIKYCIKRFVEIVGRSSKMYKQKN